MCLRARGGLTPNYITPIINFMNLWPGGPISRPASELALQASVVHTAQVFQRCLCQHMTHAQGLAYYI